MATTFSHEGKTINWQNPAAETIKSGDVFQIGTSARHAVAITDIKQGETGAAYRCGCWEFPAPGVSLDQGDDYTFNLTTQVYDAGGVVIGEVDEVKPNGKVIVLINGLPGTASTR